MKNHTRSCAAATNAGEAATRPGAANTNACAATTRPRATITRILAMFLVLVMALCVLPAMTPATQVKAEERYVTFKFHRNANGFDGYDFDNSYKRESLVTIVIDREILRADVTFVRDDLHENSWKRLEEKFPKEYELAKRFYGVTYHAVCDVIDHHNETGENGKYDFELQNFTWDDKPFLWTIDNDAYEVETHRYIKYDILEDRPIAYIGIPHLTTGPRNPMTQVGTFGVYIDNKIRKDTYNQGTWERVENTEPITIEPAKGFKMGRDNFKFVNTGSSFYTTKMNGVQQIVGGKSFVNGTRGFLLDESVYQALIKGRTANEIAALNIYLNGGFNGNCQGMSIVSGLIYEKLLSAATYGGTDTYSLKSPAEMNLELGRIIAYYQLFDFLDFRQNANKRAIEGKSNTMRESRTKLHNVVKLLEENPDDPVVVGFQFTDGRKSGGHAVLAYKVEEPATKISEDELKLIIYDPNHPEGPRSLDLFDGNVSSEEYGVVYVTQYKRAHEFFDFSYTEPFPNLFESQAVITADGDLTITVNGKYVTLKDGNVEGNLPYYVEYEQDSNARKIYVDVEVGETLNIRRHGGTNASVQMKDKTLLATGEAKELSVNSDGSATAKMGAAAGTGSFTANEAAEAGEISANDDAAGTAGAAAGNKAGVDKATAEQLATAGNNTMSNGTDSVGTFAIASSKTKGDVFGTTVQMASGEVTITPTESGAKVVADGKADITVSGATESFTFTDVDATAGVEIDSTGKESVLSSQGKEIARGKVTEDGAFAAAEPVETTEPEAEPETKPTKPTGTDKTKLKAAKGQKKQTVKATATVGSEKIAMSVDMVWDKKITYTGRKVEEFDIDYKMDLDDLYNCVPALKGSYKPEDLFVIKYVGKNNLHKSTAKKKAKIYAKISVLESDAKSAGLSSAQIERLKTIVKALNKSLKKKPCKFTINPLNLKAKGVTVQPIVYWNGNKLSYVVSVRVSYKAKGEKISLSLKGTKYKVTVANGSKKTVKVTVKGDVKGTVITKGYAESDLWKYSHAGAILSDLPDRTGYKPKNWSWKTDGDGYGLKYFTSGKYVSSDCKSVIYIESSSGDWFDFQAFAKGKGKGGKDVVTVDADDGSPYLSVWYTSQTEADFGKVLHFKSVGNGTLIVSVGSDKSSEYAAFEDIYYLVKEKY